MKLSYARYGNVSNCLKKWEAILTGTRFEIVTYHPPNALEIAEGVIPQQLHWIETLCRI